MPETPQPIGIDTSLIHVKNGPDLGRIDANGVVPGIDLLNGKEVEMPNVDAARELATLEANNGRNAAMSREAELAKGLTVEQQENLRSLEIYVQKYPHAFLPDADGNVLRRNADGQPYLFSRQMNETPSIVATQEGVSLLSGSPFDVRPVPEVLADRIWRATNLLMEDRKKNSMLPGITGMNFADPTKRDGISISLVENRANPSLKSIGSVREMAAQVKEYLTKVEEKYKTEQLNKPPEQDIEALL